VALVLGARLSSRPYFADTVAVLRLPAYLSPDPGVFELWMGVVLELRPTSGEKVVLKHLIYRRKMFRSR